MNTTLTKPGKPVRLVGIPRASGGGGYRPGPWSNRPNTQPGTQCFHSWKIGPRAHYAGKRRQFRRTWFLPGGRHGTADSQLQAVFARNGKFAGDTTSPQPPKEFGGRGAEFLCAMVIQNRSLGFREFPRNGQKKRSSCRSMVRGGKVLPNVWSLTVLPGRAMLPS